MIWLDLSFSGPLIVDVHVCVTVCVWLRVMNSCPVVSDCVRVYAPHFHVCLIIHICVRLGACDAWRWWWAYAARWNRLDVIQLSGRSSSVSPNRSSLHFHSTAAVFTSPLAQNSSAHTHAHTNTHVSCHASLLTNRMLRNEYLIKKKRGIYFELRLICFQCFPWLSV